MIKGRDYFSYHFGCSMTTGLQEHKTGHENAFWEAIAVFQVIDDDGLYLGGNYRNVKKCMNSKNM